MNKKSKVKVVPYKRYLYGLIAAIMYAIPFYYYQSLKDTPFLGFNNKETNQFIYIVIGFFALFFVLGVLFTLLALKKKETKKLFFTKNNLIKFLEIVTVIFIGISLGYFIMFYNMIIFFLLVPTSVFFIIFFIQLFKSITHKKLVALTSIVCIVFIFSSLSLSYIAILGGSDYAKQKNYLQSVLQESDITYNQYGGWDNYPSELGSFEATGFFHTTKQNGRHWLVDPLGKPFISKGMNHVDVDPGSDYEKFALQKHGSIEKWSEYAISLLRDKGYNTITSWSNQAVLDKDMPYAILLDFGVTYTQTDPNALPFYSDYFSEDFVEHTERIALQKVEPYKDSDFLLGYFTDNEIIWGVDWRNNYTLTQIYMSYNNQSEGKAVLIDMLESKTGTIGNFNAAFKTSISSFDDLWNLSWDSLDIKSDRAKELDEEFGGLVAERYAQVSNAAIRKYDNNHLNLGCRFALYPNEKIFLSIANYADVVSYAGYFENYYYTYGSKEALEVLYEKIDKPMLINEYGVRALDSNMPNFLYSGPVMLNQKQRAVEASIFIERFMYQPYAVGYHWYKFADNEKFGLLNGENYGIIDREENEYEIFNDLMLLTNNSLETIHISTEREIEYTSYKLWG